MDKNPYLHDRRADKNPYRHNGRADSQCRSIHFTKGDNKEAKGNQY